MKRKQGPYTDPQEFVRVWQSAKNLDEVAAKTGMRRTMASHRAFIYRKHGVPLKRFYRGKRRMDWKALIEFTQRLENT